MDKGKNINTKPNDGEMIDIWCQRKAPIKHIIYPENTKLEKFEKSKEEEIARKLSHQKSTP